MKEFDKFWELYPHGRRSDIAKCRTKFLKYFRQGKAPQIMEALRLQIKAYDKKVELKVDFIPAWKLSKTWLNGECWDDDIEIPKTPSRIEIRNSSPSPDLEKILDHRHWEKMKKWWDTHHPEIPYPVKEPK